MEEQRSEHGSLPKKAGGATRKLRQLGATWGHGSKGRENIRQRALKTSLEPKFWKAIIYLPRPFVHSDNFPSKSPGPAAKGRMRRHQSESPSLFSYLECGLFPFPNGFMGSCLWKKSQKSKITTTNSPLLLTILLLCCMFFCFDVLLSTWNYGIHSLLHSFIHYFMYCLLPHQKKSLRVRAFVFPWYVLGAQ